MYSTFEPPLTSSDDSDDEEDQIMKQTHFMNMTRLEDYEKNRNRFYTKDILRKVLGIQSIQLQLIPECII